MRMREATTVKCSVTITFTPPARAVSHSPWRRLCVARCTATSEEEQAVSRAMFGPCKSYRYEMRPLTTECDVPVPV